MSTPATDSIPIIRRGGYNPIPEHPFTGPTSIATRFAVAPPVSVEAVLAREEHREPVAGHPDVETTDLGLREPRRKCKCGHPHGLHEELRRGDRCTRCRACQGFELAPEELVLPATAEEERRGTRWVTGVGYAIVAFTGAGCGVGLFAAYLMLIGVLP